MSINETVLEMHYHKPLFELISKSLGLGSGSFNFYKYSPQRECFVGFDQAFIKSELTEQEMFNALKDSALNQNYRLPKTFIGLFLQYKVVKPMVNRSRTLPQSVTSRPYFRASLSTKKDLKTGYSQHELLYSLKDNDGAFVYYSCPMIFDRTDLYGDTTDLSTLRLVDLQSCPEDYSDNDSHYLYFNTPNDTPVWCSTPTDGVAYSVEELVQEIRERLPTISSSESPISLWEKLFSFAEESRGPKKLKYLDLLHESLVILEYTETVKVT